ncbi:MAG: cytochrome ubiquinol oxidase subunit I [Thermoguttaceae bacterium]|nr:cytochrome ubiquinol oxidase subunit I [Thermoguttaceae bacterium]
MYYPWLDAPFLTAPMLIAIVALLHVFVSHYAVGGGILLALENGKALRDGDAEYRAYLKRHAKFFITLTLVYGSITGVGIWFAIGLASPLATEVLIKTFAFGWAIEWCFFLLEIVSGLAFYYFWDKFSPRASAFAGWTYAFSAWISLVLITGITSFMLNSKGLIADWETTGSFWDAFLNVQFLPQTVARTGCALTLSAFYFLFHASAFAKDSDVRAQVARRMRVPSFLGIFLLVCGVSGWLYFLPESSLATLERASATNIFSGLFVGIIFAIVLLLLVGPVARPKETSLGTGLALLLLGIAGVSVAEFVREAVRKPYVVDGVVYSNQIARADVRQARQEGLLYFGTQTSCLLEELQEKEEYRDLNISPTRYLGRESRRIRKIELVPLSGEPDDNLDENLESDVEESGEPTGQDNVPDTDGSLSFVERTSALVQRARRDGGFVPTSTSQGNESAASETVEPLESEATDNLLESATSATSAPRELTGAASELGDVETSEREPAELVPEKTVAERDVEINGSIGAGNPDLLKLSDSDRLTLGRAVFLYHCNCCHAERKGYSAIAPLLAGRGREEIKNFALRLNYSHYYMPPWAGTETDAELLAEYLASIAPDYPKNALRAPQEREPKSPKNNDFDEETAIGNELSEGESGDSEVF